MNCIGACLLVIAVISKSTLGVTDSPQIDSSWEDSDRDRARKSTTLTSSTPSDNEIPSISHDSLPINQYASPPLCYQVHYQEMSETPKIICGKELQQIYLKFNPGLMKNLFVNIYLTEENTNPITIKPIESLDSIYNNTETGAAPYFEPPINPQHAEQFTALKQADEPDSPPYRAIYYYPEAQKYPDPQTLYTRVKIGPNYDLSYEKDWNINQGGQPLYPSPLPLPPYDPYAYRNFREADDENSMEDARKASPNLWNDILNSNKPFILNCLVSPVNCPQNVAPSSLPQYSNDKGGNGPGATFNNYNVYPNDISSSYEDYEETNSVFQQSPISAGNRIFYNYQDLQKLLLDPKKLQKPQTLQNSHLNPPEPVYVTRGEIVNRLPPNFESSKLRNVITQPRLVRYLERPTVSESNSFYSKIQSVPNPSAYAPLGVPTSSRLSYENTGTPLSSDPSKSVNYFIRRYDPSLFAKPVYYPTVGAPLIRRYYLKPAPAPFVTSQEIVNRPKGLSNFAVLMGYIKPIGFSSSNKQDGGPLTSSDFDNNLVPSVDPTAETGIRGTTEPTNPKKGSMTSTTETSKGLDTSLPNSGPEIAQAPEAENPETDHVQKKPAALPLEDSDSDTGNNVEQFIEGTTLLRQKSDDDQGQSSIFKDYILNLRNKEKQYEKLIVQSQARIEELQYDLDQLKKGRPSAATPYYNYGVNNNNGPFPYIPIVQHFTSLNNPFVGNPNAYYPNIPGYSPSVPVPNPLTSFPSPLIHPNSVDNIQKSSYFNPGILGKQADDLRDPINMARLNYIGTQAYVDPASLHNLVYSPWLLQKSPETTTISAAIDGADDFIDDGSVDSKPKSANIVVNNNVRTSNVNSRDGKKESKPEIEIHGDEIATGNDETTESATSTEIIESSSGAPGIDASSPITEDPAKSESTATLSDDKISDARSFERTGDFGSERKIMKSRVVNVKIVEELGSIERSVGGDTVESPTTLEPNQKSETSTDALSSFDVSSSTGFAESSSFSPETTGVDSSSTADYIVGDAKSNDFDATVNTVSSSVTESTLSPPNNMTGKPGDTSQNQSQESNAKSAESPPETLDPYIEDIVKGIKEKRNYVFDEILQNAINSNKQIEPIISKDNNSSKERVSSKTDSDDKSSQKIDKADIPVLIEAPLTIVYYPGYREWRSLKKP